MSKINKATNAATEILGNGMHDLSKKKKINPSSKKVSPSALPKPVSGVSVKSGKSSGEKSKIIPFSMKSHLTHIALVRKGEMQKTALNKKYRSTYNCWRNMKGRRATQGAKIDPAFEEFVDFLECMGPRPGKAFTVDRLDPTDPEYGPGKVRWADKKTQAVNKTNTIMLTDETGKELPLVEWAKLKGQKPNTMRKRLKVGWTDTEVIAGVRLPTNSGNNYQGKTKWIDENIGKTRKEYYMGSEIVSRKGSRGTIGGWARKLHRNPFEILHQLNVLGWGEPVVGLV